MSAPEDCPGCGDAPHPGECDATRCENCGMLAPKLNNGRVSLCQACFDATRCEATGRGER